MAKTMPTTFQSMSISLSLSILNFAEVMFQLSCRRRRQRFFTFKCSRKKIDSMVNVIKLTQVKQQKQAILKALYNFRELYFALKITLFCTFVQVRSSEPTFLDFVIFGKSRDFLQKSFTTSTVEGMAPAAFSLHQEQLDKTNKINKTKSESV